MDTSRADMETEEDDADGQLYAVGTVASINQKLVWLADPVENLGESVGSIWGYTRSVTTHRTLSVMGMFISYHLCCAYGKR